MSFVNELTELITNSSNEVQLLTASPICNSFYNGGVVKNLIPCFYRAYEHELLKNLEKLKKTNIQLYEYTKKGWTFHTKGIWINENGLENPNFTIIGSSNYSYRSYYRDSELNFYLYSMCPVFNKILS